MRLIRRATLAALAIVLMAAAWGCSQAPVGPRTTVDSPVFYDESAAAPARAGGVEEEGLVRSLLRTVTGLVTRVVDGAVGGLLRTGNWELEIPKGAYPGQASITMAPDSSGTRAVCDLVILPASKNSFSVPVKLKYKVRSAADLQAYDVLWWDPAARQWRVVTTRKDRNSLTLQADLHHFSRYAIGRRWEGKAGW